MLENYRTDRLIITESSIRYTTDADTVVELPMTGIQEIRPGFFMRNVSIMMKDGNTHKINLKSEPNPQLAINIMRVFHQNLGDRFSSENSNAELKSPRYAQTNENPEETVRKLTLQLLTRDFGYQPFDMEIEFRISMGSSRTRLDIALFAPASDHTQENVIGIVECKRADRTDDNQAIDQLKSYMAACLNARYGLIASHRFVSYQKATIDGGYAFKRMQGFMSSDGIIKPLPENILVYGQRISEG